MFPLMGAVLISSLRRGGGYDQEKSAETPAE
jgi:hypothetical protein